MKVSIGQVYVKPGVRFPFSTRMQRWLSGELSHLASPSEGFTQKFGADYALVINVSADTEIADNKVLGPTVFKKNRGVEYVLFLPYDTIRREADGRRAAAELLLAGVRAVFCLAGITTDKLDEVRTAIVERLSTDPEMLRAPWPHTG